MKVSFLIYKEKKYNEYKLSQTSKIKKIDMEETRHLVVKKQSLTKVKSLYWMWTDSIILLKCRVCKITLYVYFAMGKIHT
jgi:hypothetical protein